MVKVRKRLVMHAVSGQRLWPISPFCASCIARLTPPPSSAFFSAASSCGGAHLARLWGIVLAANLLGCFIAALFLGLGSFVPADRFDAILEVSRHFAAKDAIEHFMLGVPAGFLIAALVWVLPRMESAGEVLMIVILTYIIGLGDMSHVVVGATELFILVIIGELGLRQAMFAGVLPALAGNVLGGTGIFAALTYAQVREEI